MRKPTDGQLAIGALIAFAVWIFVVLPLLYYPRQESPQSNGHASQGKQQADNIGDEPPSFASLKLFTSTGRNEIAAYCASKTQAQKDDWAKHYICDIKITDTYLALFNLLLVVVTGGLILVGFLTIRKMRVTEERQLRAYVFVENVFYKIGSGQLGTTIKIKNFGSTPAHGVKLLSTVKETEWNDGKYTIPTLDNVEAENLGSMAPNGDFYESDEKPFTPDFDALWRGTHVICVVGTISYRTVFRKTEMSNFRYHIGGDDPLDLTISKGELYADAEGNDAT